MLSENKYRGKGVMGNLFLFHSTLITASSQSPVASRQSAGKASRQSPVASRQERQVASRQSAVNSRKRQVDGR